MILPAHTHSPGSAERSLHITTSPDSVVFLYENHYAKLDVLHLKLQVGRGERERQRCHTQLLYTGKWAERMPRYLRSQPKQTRGVMNWCNYWETLHWSSLGRQRGFCTAWGKKMKEISQERCLGLAPRALRGSCSSPVGAWGSRGLTNQRSLPLSHFTIRKPKPKQLKVTTDVLMLLL